MGAVATSVFIPRGVSVPNRGARIQRPASETRPMTLVDLRQSFTSSPWYSRVAPRVTLNLAGKA